MSFNPVCPRFFIALVPPLEIQRYAESIILELSDRYQTGTAKAPPHVTLQAPFQWQRDRLPDLEACLEQLVQQHPPVPVHLSGFSAFAPRVLYINVLKTEGLLELQSALANCLESSLEIADPQAKRRSFSPHLTVASRNMTPSIFKQAWADLEPRQVELEFSGDRLTLLIHDGHQWHIHREFPFVRKT